MGINIKLSEDQFDQFEEGWSTTVAEGVIAMLDGEMTMKVHQRRKREFVERFVSDVADEAEMHRVRSAVDGWAFETYFPDDGPSEVTCDKVAKRLHERIGNPWTLDSFLIADEFGIVCTNMRDEGHDEPYRVVADEFWPRESWSEYGEVRYFKRYKKALKAYKELVAEQLDEERLIMRVAFESFDGKEYQPIFESRNIQNGL